MSKARRCGYQQPLLLCSATAAKRGGALNRSPPPLSSTLLPQALLIIFLFVTVLLPAPAWCLEPGYRLDDTARMIIFSIDGLLPPADLPNHDGLTNFKRLWREGACTNNARIDTRSSQTLPEHISMLTGKFVRDHGWEEDYNWKPSNPELSSALDYNNVFDLAQTKGKTCMFVAKSKLQIFEQSFVGVDFFFFNKKGAMAINEWLSMRDECIFTFLHVKEPDTAGHRHGGHSKRGYLGGVESADVLLGRVLDNIPPDTGLAVTTDHGFERVGNHNDEMDVHVYKIPFCAWGPGVTQGADLYELNPGIRADPGGAQTNEDTFPQPIRPHDATRLALDFLGVDVDIADESKKYLINYMYVGDHEPGSHPSPAVTTTTTVDAGTSLPVETTAAAVITTATTMPTATTTTTAETASPGPSTAQPHLFPLDYCDARKNRGEECTSPSECCSYRCSLKTNPKNKNFGKTICQKAVLLPGPAPVQTTTTAAATMMTATGGGEGITAPPPTTAGGGTGGGDSSATCTLGKKGDPCKKNWECCTTCRLKKNRKTWEKCRG